MHKNLKEEKISNFDPNSLNFDIFGSFGIPPNEPM